MLNTVHEMTWLGARVVNGPISLDNNVITNLYHLGNYHPQSCIKNVFLGQKMCCLWHPSQSQESHFMVDPSLFFLLPVLLPVLGQQITKPPVCPLQHLNNFQTCVVPFPQGGLLVLAVLHGSSQKMPPRFPRLMMSPDLRTHTNHRSLSDPVNIPHNYCALLLFTYNCLMTRSPWEDAEKAP